MLLILVVSVEDRKRNERTFTACVCVFVHSSCVSVSVCDLTSCCSLITVHLDTIPFVLLVLFKSATRRCSLPLAEARILHFESGIKQCVCESVCSLLSHVGGHCNGAMEDAAADTVSLERLGKGRGGIGGGFIT